MLNSFCTIDEAITVAETREDDRQAVLVDRAKTLVSGGAAEELANLSPLLKVTIWARLPVCHMVT